MEDLWFVVNMGYVKIAVHAYVYLLWHSQVKDVVLYAQELIIKENPVVRISLLLWFVWELDVGRLRFC